MGRIRSIKPEFTQDEELSSLPAETHLLAAGLLCYSDDDGYFNANHGLVKAAIFPLRESSLSIHDILTQLANIGFIRLGTAADGKHYGHVVKFTEHQRVNRPTPSKIKGLPIQWENSVSTHGGLSEDSLPERKGKEGKGIYPPSEQKTCSDSMSSSRKKKTAKTPLPENFDISGEVRKWAQERGHTQLEQHLEYFIGYAKAHGAKYMNWDQAFQNAIRDDWAKLGSHPNGNNGKPNGKRQPLSPSEISRRQQAGEEWRQ